MAETATAAAPVGEVPDRLAFQFDDSGQQHDAATMGMWTFLATEVMFFGGIFLGYGLFRWQYFEAFAEGSRKMSLTWGAINTAVLLTSSLTMALAVREAQLGRARNVFYLLVMTMVLGAAFLGIKAFEWTHDWHEGLVPRLHWTQTGPNAEHMQLFFWCYFFMTGLHGLHMIIGLGLVGTIAYLAYHKRATSNQVDVTGLYWHFVDIVWVFLYPLLYLIEVSKH